MVTKQNKYRCFTRAEINANLMTAVHEVDQRTVSIDRTSRELSVDIKKPWADKFLPTLFSQQKLTFWLHSISRNWQNYHDYLGFL